jgi:hypothetical protein
MIHLRQEGQKRTDEYKVETTCRRNIAQPMLNPTRNTASLGYESALVIRGV